MAGPSTCHRQEWTPNQPAAKQVPRHRVPTGPTFRALGLDVTPSSGCRACSSKGGHERRGRKARGLGSALGPTQPPSSPGTRPPVPRPYLFPEVPEQRPWAEAAAAPHRGASPTAASARGQQTPWCIGGVGGQRHKTTETPSWAVSTTSAEGTGGAGPASAQPQAPARPAPSPYARFRALLRLSGPAHGWNCREVGITGASDQRACAVDY